MPFKSEAQRKKFHVLADQGEMSQATVHKWEEHTPNKSKLPEHVKKTAEVLATLQKRALWEKIMPFLANIGGKTTGLVGKATGAMGVGNPLKSFVTGGGAAANNGLMTAGRFTGTSADEMKKRLAMIGGGTLGAGALAGYGGYRMLEGKLKEKEASLSKCALLGTLVGTGYGFHRDKGRPADKRRDLRIILSSLAGSVGGGIAGMVPGLFARNPVLAGLGALGGDVGGGRLGGRLATPQDATAKQAEALGTPFMDGFLSRCLELNLNADQMSDLLEKGAAVEGQVGEECKQFTDKVLKS